MNLPKETIIEFQKIYKEEYGIELSESEASVKALKFLKLFKQIYRPIKISNMRV